MAERVVRGESAVDLLDDYTGGRRVDATMATSGPVQHEPEKAGPNHSSQNTTKVETRKDLADGSRSASGKLGSTEYAFNLGGSTVTINTANANESVELPMLSAEGSLDNFEKTLLSVPLPMGLFARATVSGKFGANVSASGHGSFTEDQESKTGTLALGGTVAGSASAMLALTGEVGAGASGIASITGGLRGSIKGGVKASGNLSGTFTKRENDPSNGGLKLSYAFGGALTAGLDLILRYEHPWSSKAKEIGTYTIGEYDLLKIEGKGWNSKGLNSDWKSELKLTQVLMNTPQSMEHGSGLTVEEHNAALEQYNAILARYPWISTQRDVITWNRETGQLVASHPDGSMFDEMIDYGDSDVPALGLPMSDQLFDQDSGVIGRELANQGSPSPAQAISDRARAAANPTPSNSEPEPVASGWFADESGQLVSGDIYQSQDGYYGVCR